ncbi:hypothetical protein [Pseudorhodoferax sp. Leaf267]|uniref:hypothetical protein n=1 Tax=Pseudorhodoferax sp. Leaf267 TaxID=1736316 RepID=UPI001F2F27AD|nr:hypothetical protein [Pseudorhodoferax sp. Leaf267]
MTVNGVPLWQMHTVVTVSSLPLFLGALLTDWAYASSYQIQWTNFADWLNVGGLTLAGVALAWAAVAEIVSPRRHAGRRWLDVALLAVTVVLGIANAFVHAKDGWAAMPAAPILSMLVMVVAMAASVVGLTRLGRRAHQ